MIRFRSRYRPGDWVEVKSFEEIRATLDENGETGKLPFMPEMLRFCGSRFRVAASAHKTCDTVNKTGGRRLSGALHLEGMRCDGSGHDGCQARCSFFWKDAWVKPASSGLVPAAASQTPVRRPGDEAIFNATRSRNTDQDVVFSCQATRLFDATSPLPWWSPRQYLDDVLSGNETLGEAMKVLALACLYRLREISIGYRLWRWIYERAHRSLRGQPIPYGTGQIPRGSPTPKIELRLKPGETVFVRPHEEILATLDTRNKNRGLSFDKEMVRYCGKSFEVVGRVEKIIDESSGRMLQLPLSSVILEGTFCTSRYSERRLLCPRRLTPFWREAWLARALQTQGDGDAVGSEAAMRAERS